jgi:DNA-binding NarL/FixJ family response regulator
MSQLKSRTAVIVDQHPLWLDALQALLERLDLEVVGRATTRNEAQRLVDEFEPDLLLADYSTLEGDGGLSSSVDSLGRAREANPEITCILLSQDDDPTEREQAFAAGASVFCVKRVDPDDLAAAIRQSFDHSIFFASSKQAKTRKLEEPAKADGTVGLTKREIEILRLTADGYSNSQLACKLRVTEQTVKFHLSNIYRKLDVSNRTEASRWAQRSGLLNVETAA